MNWADQKVILSGSIQVQMTQQRARVEMDVTQLTFGQLKYLRFIQDHPGSSKIIQESCMLDESFRFIQVKWRFCRSIEVVFSECVFVVVWSNGFIALPAQNQLCTLKSEVRFPCIGWLDVRWTLDEIYHSIQYPPQTWGGCTKNIPPKLFLSPPKIPPKLGGETMSPPSSQIWGGPNFSSPPNLGGTPPNFVHPPQILVHPPQIFGVSPPNFAASPPNFSSPPNF